jgi:uncharacterized membrane protein HdeD (DUF308 family)
LFHLWRRYQPFAENRAIHRFPSAIRRNRVSPDAAACYRDHVLSTGGNVNNESSYEWRKQLMWGLVLVCVGITIFLDRVDLIDVQGLWHYLPLLLVVFGVNKMIGYPTAKHFTNGLWEVFMGLWLFMVFEHIFGLTFRNSWPFVIIASGISMILEPIIKRRFASNEESNNEK